MAVTADRISVTTAATLIAQNTAASGADDASTKSFGVINVTGTANVFLGPSGVTTSNGVQWDSAAIPVFSIDLEPGEALYGRVAATTQTLHVLGTGR